MGMYDLNTTERAELFVVALNTSEGPQTHRVPRISGTIQVVDDGTGDARGSFDLDWGNNKPVHYNTSARLPAGCADPSACSSGCPEFTFPIGGGIQFKFVKHYWQCDPKSGACSMTETPTHYDTRPGCQFACKEGGCAQCTNCQATPEYAPVAGMNDWCRSICSTGSGCPSPTCSCVQEEAAPVDVCAPGTNITGFMYAGRGSCHGDTGTRGRTGNNIVGYYPRNSAVACADACRYNSACKSFNYYYDKNICQQLGDVSITKTGIPNVGYYIKKP
jgi:hypothetical protein